MLSVVLLNAFLYFFMINELMTTFHQVKASKLKTKKVLKFQAIKLENHLQPSKCTFYLSTRASNHAFVCTGLVSRGKLKINTKFMGGSYKSTGPYKYNNYV